MENELTRRAMEFSLVSLVVEEETVNVGTVSRYCRHAAEAAAL